MREGWTIQVFDSFEAADAADREENMKRTGLDRIRILTAISTPDAEGPEPRLPRPNQLLDFPLLGSQLGDLPGD